MLLVLSVLLIDVVNVTVVVDIVDTAADVIVMTTAVVVQPSLMLGGTTYGTYMTFLDSTTRRIAYKVPVLAKAITHSKFGIS